MGSGGHKPHEAIDISPGDTLWTRIETLTQTQGRHPEEEALLDADVVAVSHPLTGSTNETLEMKLSTGDIAYFKPMEGTKASTAALYSHHDHREVVINELPDRLRVREAIDRYASFYAQPADGDLLLDQLGLTAKRNAAFGKLSGGQRQRLSIALALIGSPEIVVLDELTTGLDPQARRDTWNLIEQIRDRRTTIGQRGRTEQSTHEGRMEE